MAKAFYDIYLSLLQISLSKCVDSTKLHIFYKFPFFNLTIKGGMAIMRVGGDVDSI